MEMISHFILLMNIKMEKHMLSFCKKAFREKVICRKGKVTFKEKEGDLSGNHWFHTNFIRQ